MGRRGRPRHPDVLTPREWEVLGLLREGLTNEQIAERLSVSFATARYHVSEILSKLGVSSREEAAAWQPEPERRAWWRLAWPLTAAKAAGAALTLAALAGLGVFAWGVLGTEVGESDGESLRVAVDNTPTPSPVRITEDEALGYVMLAVGNGRTRPSPELFEISAEAMLFGEAVPIAARYGLGLIIQPEGYQCGPPAYCPYSGEPADERGWLFVVGELGDYTPYSGVTRMIAWVGEDAGMVSNFVP